jgi:DNA-binding XRE family transcriptional regulator
MPSRYSRYENNIPLKGIDIKKSIQSRPDLQAIGRRIREIRGFDLTQAEFGRLLGVGQTQMSKYEMGQSVPTLEFLFRLKAYSGKSIDWIVTGEDVVAGKR